MMKHHEFRKGGKVSIWIGNFVSDMELDDYMNMQRTFEKDFGFELNDRDMPEATVTGEAVAISELVDGFSRSEYYAQSVIELSEIHGIKTATTMIVFLNFEYQPAQANPNPKAPLQFLGSVNFSD